MSSQPAPDLFRRACAQWATGIAVITTTDDAGVPHGMTVNSFTSVSLDPPIVLVCIDQRATILPNLTVGRALAVNILAEEQTEVSSRFARKTEDRFENLDWASSAAGNPVLAGSLALFECVVSNSIKVGDHYVVLAQVRSVEFQEGRPLLYFDSGYETLG